MGGFLEDVVVVVLVEVGVTESGVVFKGVVEEPWAWEEVRLVFLPTVRPSSVSRSSTNSELQLEQEGSALFDTTKLFPHSWQ